VTPGDHEEDGMAQVSVLGLGAMGSRLARVLLERGHDVTVWNRSDSGRAAALAAAGATRAAAPAEATLAAPLILMCVTDYPAADEVLAAPGVLDALAGRTLAQLTNGNEDQVRAQLARVRAAGGRMLAGGILGYPRHIGRPETVITYAGDAGAFQEHAATLADLAGAQGYYGEDPGPPNAVYVAAFGFYFAALAGFLEAAALAESRGVPAGEFAAAMPGMTALLLDHIGDAARRIEVGDFAGDQATVDVHLVGSARRQRTLEDAGLGSLMTGAFVEYCRRAAEAREGGEDIAALFKRMRAAPAE
jgi:3-hydroxyisobutyrate dehydrogenase-like beta-hydroxyacid dehydrogenase